MNRKIRAFRLVLLPLVWLEFAPFSSISGLCNKLFYPVTDGLFAFNLCLTSMQICEISSCWNAQFGVVFFH